MGASASIEVSFIDNKTGELLSDEKIEDLTHEAQKVIDSYDFSSDFYSHYNKPDAYKQLAEKWKQENTYRNNITITYASYT